MSSNYGLPHPPEIYRRRRIAAVVILVVLILLLWWIISALTGGGDDSKNTSATSSASVSSVSSTTTSSSASSSEESSEPSSSEESPTSSAEPSASVAADAKDTCDVGDLQIEARADKDTYAAGEMPKLYLVATNPTRGDCHIDLAVQKMKFEIYDLQTNRRVWSDVDCNAPAATGALDIGSGESKTYMLSWSRTTSAPGQCTERQAVPSGSYYLHTLVGDNHSDAHTFNLA